MRRSAFRPRWIITAIAALVFAGLLVLAWRVPNVRFPILLIAAGVTFVVFVATCVLVVPAWLVRRDTNVNGLDAEQLATAKNSIRTALIQGVVGLTALAGITVAWQQLQADREQLQTDRQQLQEQLTVTRQGQVAERFTRAVEQLGSDKVDVRLGGIYGLEQIARQSPNDRLQIFEVLSAYVRQHARGDPKRPQRLELQARAPDVQAAMTVLGRRDASQGDPLLNLNGVDLRLRVNLGSAKLQGAILNNANLQEAGLVGANLQEASLFQTNLRRALLYQADLRRASPWYANLAEANLVSTNLQGANLISANLQGANLTNANLQDANLNGADLRQARLNHANLEGANLLNTKIDGATADAATKWPDGFDPNGANIRLETTP